MHLKEMKEQQNYSTDNKNNNFTNSKYLNNDNYSNNYSKRTSRQNIEEMAEIEIRNSLEGIKFHIRKNNFNLFQLMSEKAMDNNKEEITKNNLLNCLKQLNIDINDEQLTRLLIKYDLFKNYNSVPIKEFSKLLIEN